MKKCAVYLFSHLYNLEEMSMNEQYCRIKDFCRQNGYEITYALCDMEAHPDTPSDYEGFHELCDILQKDKECTAMMMARGNTLLAIPRLEHALSSYLSSMGKTFIVVE